MLVYGEIYDNQTNSPIPGASVTLVNSLGNPTGGGVAADQDGYFSLNSPTFEQGGKLLISAVGYKSAVVDPAIIVNNGSFGLDEDPNVLPTATVTAHVIRKPNYTRFLMLAGGGLLLLATRKKKKRTVGAIGAGVDWTKVGEYALIGGGAYFLVLKPILQSLGILAKGPSVQDKATADAEAASLAAAKAAAQQSGQGAASYTADQYTGWANDIQILGTRSTPVTDDNQRAIVADVTNVNNMVDLQSLITAFGVRQMGGNMCNWFNMYCTSYDLPAFLKSVLDTVHLNNLNLYLSQQGINYQF